MGNIFILSESDSAIDTVLLAGRSNSVAGGYTSIFVGANTQSPIGSGTIRHVQMDNVKNISGSVQIIVTNGGTVLGNLSSSPNLHRNVNVKRTIQPIFSLYFCE